MRNRLIAVALASALVTAGVMAFTAQSGSTTTTAPVSSTSPGSPMRVATPAAPVEPEESSTAYVDDFKAGYADGFGAGAGNFGYPDQASMGSNTRGYLEGFNEGYTDGAQQQPALRQQLCGGRVRVSGVSGAAPNYSYGSPQYGSSNGVVTRSPSLASSNGSSTGYSNGSGAYTRAPVNRGIGTTARRALMIGGGAAAGAGLGGAIGGKRGALIGAIAGGGTGTALAISKRPKRAFNRRVDTKDVLLKSLIGAGAGAGIGALAGGKRGALAGAGMGGGGGAIFSLLSGRQVDR
jgi:hypothetical protein